MALELRPNCECCDRDLPPASTLARICSYECTFCADCVDTVLFNVCRTAAAALSRGRSARRPNGGPDCPSPSSRLRPSAYRCPTAATTSRRILGASRTFRLRSAEALQLLADQAISRIGPPAADRDVEHHNAEQQHIFIAALADRKSGLEMHDQQRDQQLDRERRRKEAR